MWLTCVALRSWWTLSWTLQTNRGSTLTLTPTLTLTYNPNPNHRFNHLVKYQTAGAPPPPPVIKKFQDEMGAKVYLSTNPSYLYTYLPTSSIYPCILSHSISSISKVLCAYGLTEVHGINCYATPDPELDHQSEEEKLVRSPHYTANLLQEVVKESQFPRNKLI